MKVWAWIKTTASKLMTKLPKLLTRRREEAEPAPGVLTELDKRLGKEIQRRQAKGKAVDTHQGGPNMPGSQPCPICRRRSKRVEKIDEGHYRGAYYSCPKHGKFFVSA